MVKTCGKTSSGAGIYWVPISSAAEKWVQTNPGFIGYEYLVDNILYEFKNIATFSCGEKNLGDGIHMWIMVCESCIRKAGYLW